MVPKSCFSDQIQIIPVVQEVIPSLEVLPTETQADQKISSIPVDDDDDDDDEEITKKIKKKKSISIMISEEKTKYSPLSSPPPEVLSGRERLKRHRMEVAGQVWIPDLWGQEELLKDWIDCSGFDKSLFPKGIKSARAALVEEGRRSRTNSVRT